MESLKLREGFYWTGIVDADLRVFDIIMYTEFGTTYNSYVLKAGDQTVLFETAKAKFVEEYLEELSQITEAGSIDYLVVDHTEPDHAGSIERLLELNPGMKILGSPCALGFLKEIVNRDFVGIPVSDGQEMQIGNKKLRFLSVPNLHWPDTIYTYIEEDQILVTCDSFGSHYAAESVLLSGVKNWEDYRKAAKYYFDNIIGPFKPYMQKALKKIEGLDISMICTGHGPVIDEKVDLIINTYQEWSRTDNPNPRKTVIMPYVSAYGYTRSLAERIAEGIRDSGEVDVRLYDMVEADQGKVLGELGYADGILLGSPTIVGEALKPIWDLTTSMFAETHGGKLAAAFGSYGWSGEAVPHLTERLKQLRMRVLDGFRVRFKPSENQLQDAYDYGFNFGCALLEKENPKKKGGRRLVKCLVCGAIFDASLEICPVCGVGKENFIEVEAEENTFSNNTEEFYVILGNGAAGFHAAKAIRERDKTGTVVMISDEPWQSYNRPMLTKSIMSGLSAEQIEIEPKSWYEENNIYQILGRKVQKIDVEGHKVLLDDGNSYHYTKLIYALGSECFIPPIAGTEKAGVYAIRRLSDTEKVAARLETAKHAAVIGGGVLGLEAAWELRKAGCQVTVLEMAPVLMGRQLDASAGQMLREISESQGIEIRTGVQIEAIEGGAEAEGVKLSDGAVIPAELVVISAGVRANAALAKDAGIDTDRAVIVNERMETSLPDIYACGDCAQYEGVNLGIWPQAVEEGTVAGAQAAGDKDAVYKPVSAALSFNGMNTSLFAAGDNGKQPELIYKTVEFRDPARKQYQKYYFRNNRLCGVILLGDTSRMAEMTEALEKHKTYQEILG